MINLKVNLCICLTVILGIQGNQGYAQSHLQIDSSWSELKSSLIFSIDALSSAIYSGRNYGVEQMGLNPSITYNHKTGLTLSVYSYGMEKTKGLITETDMGVSFIKRIGTKLTVAPGYTYIFNRIQSEKMLYSVLNLAAGFNTSIFSINNYVGFCFGGGRTSWYEEFSLSKYISLLYREKASLAISPTVVGIMGTRYALTNESANVVYPALIPEPTESNKFSPLCYGFQLPVTFTHKQFSLTLTQHYDIPVNVIKPMESSIPGNPYYITGKLSITLSKKSNKQPK
ncbi:MAG: hypothetical protein ACOYMF_09675 [Bacteroidales bacterium]